jgi:D-arabinose 1-dehydrogenase-like Zn-dependent alcohol dehydrogenase
MTIQSHVFRGIEGSVKKVPLEIPSELGPKQVLIKITHSSLCGTDVHYIPHSSALGHEGVGIVEKIGSEVSQFKVGDRAGAGYLRNASSLSPVYRAELIDAPELRTL